VQFRKTLLIGMALGLFVALIPLAAYGAVSLFDDVPDDGIFVEDINWMKTTGVAVGCNPPLNTEYCPTDFVRRDQMAAFLHRLAANQVVDAASVEGLTAEELRGQTGDTGPAGPQGREGDPGVLGFYTNSAAAAAGTPGRYEVDVWCEPGDAAVGGGVQLFEVAYEFFILESVPTSTATEWSEGGWTPTGWMSLREIRRESILI
jgi:hypothetical protein